MLWRIFLFTQKREITSPPDYEPVLLRNMQLFQIHLRYGKRTTATPTAIQLYKPRKAQDAKKLAQIITNR